MGRDLAEADSECMELWKEAERISALPLREIYWDGDDSAMSDTRALQPALTVVNITLFNRVKGTFSPVGAAGHSLGEFSALVCAGVLSVKDAIAVTSLRGFLMSQADPDGQGSMAAVVKLDQETVARLVEEASSETGELLICANFNSPLQTVISGTKKACTCCLSKVKAEKGRALPLKVSAAFHSPMMSEANKELSPLLQKVSWHTARFPVYGNVDGLPERDGERLREKMLTQMVSPVMWMKSVEEQYRNGCRSWLEIGPKSILNKMVTACLEGKDDLAFDSISSLESAEAFKAGMGV